MLEDADYTVRTFEALYLRLFTYDEKTALHRYE
jgi:hypothetical protein